MTPNGALPRSDASLYATRAVTVAIGAVRIAGMSAHGFNGELKEFAEGWRATPA